MHKWGLGEGWSGVKNGTSKVMEVRNLREGTGSRESQCRAQSLGEWGQDWAEQKDLLSASDARGPTCECSSSSQGQRPHAHTFMSAVSVLLHHSSLRAVLLLFPLTEEEMET